MARVERTKHRTAGAPEVGGEVDQDFCSGERDCCFGDEIMDSLPASTQAWP